MTDAFDTLTDSELAAIAGGSLESAYYIMTAESGGDTEAGRLEKIGRGDGSPGNPSSAFGAFQMTKENRLRYMGANYQSTDFALQFAAANHYVHDRYGGWDAAATFKRANGWY
jgi:bacteriocin-like protein